MEKLIRKYIKKILTESFINEIHVFRGGAKEYDNFDMDKIGTGDGKSLGGWGIYCSDSEAVAERYFTTGGIIKEFDIRDGNYFISKVSKICTSFFLEYLKSFKVTGRPLSQSNAAT